MQHKLLVSVQARAARASWKALLEVAPQLGKNWVLVGGQMVTVHAAEQPDSMLRETTDADIVMDLRMQADGLDQADRALRNLGFDQRISTVTNAGHRYVRGEAKINILSPDHLGNRNPLKLGLGRSLAVRGASRALARARQVSIEFEDSTALVRVPSPVGALVVKGSALYYHMSGEGRSVGRHRDDLATLLKCCDLSSTELPLSRSERGILKRIASDVSLPKSSRISLQRFLDQRGHAPSALALEAHNAVLSRPQQCAHLISNSRRCRNTTSHLSGKCHLHR